jgi:hypothetical protein
MAAGFFLTSLTLAYLATNESGVSNNTQSVMEQAITVPIVPSDVPMIDVPLSDIPN